MLRRGTTERIGLLLHRVYIKGSSLPLTVTSGSRNILLIDKMVYRFGDPGSDKTMKISVTSGKAGGMYCEPLKAVVKTISHLKVADYSNRPSWSIRLSKVS